MLPAAWPVPRDIFICTKGRIATTSTSPDFVVVDTSIRRPSDKLVRARVGTNRFVFSIGGLLNFIPVRSEPRNSGDVTICWRLSRAANKAVPINKLEVMPVRNVPHSHRADTSRRSIDFDLPPTTSGGSFPI